MSKARQYRDIADILAQKTLGRRERASLSFAEKLAILDKLREEVAPIVQARQARALMRKGQSVASQAPMK